MKTSCFIIAALGATWLSGEAAAQTLTPLVTSPEQVAISQPLTQGTDDFDVNIHRVYPTHPLPHHRTGPDHDDVMQTSAGSLLQTLLGTSFPGVSANGNAPPDTNMAVGPNHILQTVNSRYAIYNKNGALLVGPNSLSSLWSPLSGSGCATNNGGDVVAQYDKLADRFIVTQLGALSAPYSECIAISKTNDPTGQYWLYSYGYGTTLNDYPKFGVWPTATNSAYTATYNMFANGQTFTGGQLCAYDRIKMLAGDQTAQSICYNINLDGGYLPADLDGSTPPLDGTPAYFLNYETLSSLRMYALAPDFSNPGNSTLSIVGSDIPVAPFSEACATSFDTCIPQGGTHQKLDALGDRLMYRLAFRNFGDHEAMVVNHSVTVGARVGVRWYELRAPVSSSGAFSLYQQGTYAPDTTFRWMGSAAMDTFGDIAIGYSVSSGSIHPAIRYSGRLASDPLGTLESEVSMIEGTGSQTKNLSRWGDYTAMRIDPADDCTFWYTNEYLQSSGSFNWSTAFGSFRFASCVVPDFSISANPPSLTLTQGETGNSSVTLTALNGFNGSVGLSISGCPSGATCSIGTPVNPNPTASSTLTVSTNLGTSTGPFTLTITGAQGALSHAATLLLTVNPAGSTVPVNVALASNGGVAVTSSTYSIGFSEAGAINGDRKGLPWGNGGGWNDATPNVFPDSLEVDFNGTQTIGEIDIFSVQDDFSAPSDPTPTMTFSLYGLRDFQVQYWTGSAWATVTGGTISGNNLVWRKVVFTPLATSKIRVNITATADGVWSRITEIEAYTNTSTTPDFSISANPPSLTISQGGTGTSTVTLTALNAFSGSVGLSVSGCPSGATCSIGTPVTPNPTAASTLTVSTNSGTSTGPFTLTITGTQGALSHAATVLLTVNSAGTPINVALASNGGVAVASTFSTGFSEAGAINGDRKGLSWGNGGGWNDATPNVFPDSLEVDFNGTQTIAEIDIFSVQDNFSAPSEPTSTMTFSLYGLRDFQVQYWTGGAWATVTGGTISGNNLVWRKVTFTPLATSKIRVIITATADGVWSRITELEAYTASP